MNVWALFRQTQRVPLRSRGFTLIEMLIIVGCIGVLAVIGYMGYSGVQTRTLNAAKDHELWEWVSRFETYKNLNGGSYPMRAVGAGYCLGDGFPDTSGDGTGDCRVLANPAERYSVDAGLNAALKTVGSLPSGPRDAVNGSMGPFVQYLADNLRIVEVIKGGPTECPKGTTYLYHDSSGKLQCYVQLNF